MKGSSEIVSNLLEAKEKEIEILKEQVEKLSAKLHEARSEAGVHRLRHQNNEMRVMMNRLHRHLSAGKLDVAIAEWAACNDWLSKNKIDPYEGAVPGYSSPSLADD